MVNREDLISGTRPEVGNKILMTASDHFDGYTIINYNGMVWGISIRAKDIGTDYVMGCKQTFGGELTSFTELADEGRQRAVDRMLEMAQRVGANALINFRFHNQNIDGLTEVTAYATAVIIKPIRNYVPVGAIGNILVDIADSNAFTNNAAVNSAPAAKTNPPKQNRVYPFASLKLTEGKLFAVCPSCNTFYNATLLTDKVVEVKGYQDVDDEVQGQQIRCEHCNTIFSLPSIS